MSPQRRVTKAQQRSAALKVFRAQHALEDAAIREQLRLLAEMRRATLSALGEASGFRLFHLSQVLAAIDREIERGRAAAQQLASRSTTRAYRLGADLVDGAIFSVGPSAGGLADVSPELLSALLDVTNDQIRSVWSELGTSLKATVRRTALGITDPFAAMGEIARMIRNPKVFGTPMNRAEVIIRTEVNRTFSIATQSRLEQSDERLGGGLGKWWLAVDDDRTRPDHAEAGRRYGPDNPIPVDQAFIVGGERLMYPLDPNGSAEQTIQCRCRSVPSVLFVRLPAPIRLAS
jgi:hypothetical protein